MTDKLSELREANMETLIERRHAVRKQIEHIRDVYLAAAEFELIELRQQEKIIAAYMAAKLGIPDDRTRTGNGEGMAGIA